MTAGRTVNAAGARIAGLSGPGYYASHWRKATILPEIVHILPARRAEEVVEIAAAPFQQTSNRSLGGGGGGDPVSGQEGERLLRGRGYSSPGMRRIDLVTVIILIPGKHLAAIENNLEHVGRIAVYSPRQPVAGFQR